jgi:hypothetical protein
MGVPSETEGGRRWSLDHLFLDQDGIPTLVEVKRSSDSRIRREVVGQLLDYAANAVALWPVEEIQGRFHMRCEKAGLDAAGELASFLGGEVGDTAVFWSKVKINLHAGRIRLMFVANMIPLELQRIVEFLNAQMDPAEALALEIRQYAGEGLQALVPRVIGQTAQAQQKKSPPSDAAATWDETTFFAATEDQCGEASARAARQLFDWAKAQGRVWFGRGKRSGSFGLAITLNGRTRIPFGTMEGGGRVDDPLEGEAADPTPAPAGRAD